MSRIAYINGRYLPHARALTHIEDRGYQFADGVYEYCAFYNRRLLDRELHLARLARSLQTLGIAAPMPDAALKLVMEELIGQNLLADGG
ncbi:MAG: D-amino acid aminotransferase, partial [Alphaproteobacteria bacterium]|nr:D-amino acid aminotransferase [Alphaproteobacteria bacterium]